MGLAVGAGVARQLILLSGFWTKPSKQQHSAVGCPFSPVSTQHIVLSVSQPWLPVAHTCSVGMCVGSSVGSTVGSAVGSRVGLLDGLFVGRIDGRFVGSRVGSPVVGSAVGSYVGACVGAKDGAIVARQLILLLRSTVKPSRQQHAAVAAPSTILMQHIALSMSQPWVPVAHACSVGMCEGANDGASVLVG